MSRQLPPSRILNSDWLTALQALGQALAENQTIEDLDLQQLACRNPFLR